MTEFVHLHVHTEYSLLDGAIRIGELIKVAKSYNMPAVAITDHGNMYGALEFYEKAKSDGIKPIIGCEVYLTPYKLKDQIVELKRSRNEDDDRNYHLVLLAMDYEGYKNLMKIVSTAHLEGFYYKPCIDKDHLATYSKGLVALSSCIKGELARNILKNRLDKAQEAAQQYVDIFGKENFYLELQSNGLKEQYQVNDELIRLSKALGLKLVATSDCHYLERSHARAHEILLCIQTNKTIFDEKRMRFQTDELYFKSPDEMTQAFRHVPEAIKHTLEIAERCNLEIPLGDPIFPVFPLDKDETAETRFERIVREGLEKRWQQIRTKFPEKEREVRLRTYQERLEKEIAVIKKTGFAPYFLIVADFIGYSKSQGIPVGPGRGSAAGSLAAYAMGITDIDPIEHGLLFERFLNEERISMPDIDVDFCQRRRDEVLKYVTEKYGADKVAHITTFGTMQAKQVVRDVGRALGISYSEVDKIAKLIPDSLGMTLKRAFELEPKLEELRMQDPQYRELFDIAFVLEGLARHASTHAAGVVIADRPIVEYVPLYRDQNGEIVTQYSMKYVEKVGLIKFDFLGLRNLTVIDETVKMIKQNYGIELDMLNIPLDDKATYELLSRGETTGIFQLESSGMRDILVRLRPERFSDIVALVALYRPGPIQSGMVDQYIRGKHGEIPIKYELDELEEILQETYGVILYQEQVMQIASRLANYSLGEADILRRAMGKKIPEVMQAQRDRFLQGARENGISDEKANKIFDQMEKFALYGFNKSHSAAYAFVTYQTAYLKAHYPLEFTAALMNSVVSNSSKIVKLINECREKGISVLPPDINASNRGFTVSDGKIRFGLAAVKNVGDVAVEAIIENREGEGPFTSIFDFCERVDLQKVNRRVIEQLIKCGAFDSLHPHRAQVMNVLDIAIERAQLVQKERQGGQKTLFDLLNKTPQRREKQTSPVQLPEVTPWDEKTILRYEKESLGFYVSSHPMNLYKDRLERICTGTSQDIESIPDGTEVVLAGIISVAKELTTKKGEKMAFLQLEDKEGLVDLVVFPEAYAALWKRLNGGDDPFIVIGIVQNQSLGVEIDEENGVDDNQQGGGIARRGNVKVIVKEILDLEEAEGRAIDSLIVHLKNHNIQKDDLFRLRNIIFDHRGNCPLFLKLCLDTSCEVVILLGDEYRVKPSNVLLENLRKFFGVNSVELIYSAACGT
ncbi:MAG: DNA polymerase III subunit alpha [Syntrophobacterales bacterium]|nr:DNA polymerase III subunit alpha [Syntrophobacterales bacterium]